MMHPEPGTEGPLICLYCAAALVREAGAWRCTNGHAFDVARDGTVYLRRTRNAGDDADMLRARRAFLDRGHYAPLADLLSRAVEDFIQDAAHVADVPLPIDLLDSGCGEGYYLESLQRHLAASVPAAHCRYWGLDSSRHAAHMAARRCREGQVIVGDCKDLLPFATGSLGVLIDVFAPRNPAEFARVLAPGGLLLVVIPNPDHLAALREGYSMLGIEEDKERHVLASLDGCFSAPALQTLELHMDLMEEEISWLIAMSPSGRHLDAALLAPRGQEGLQRVTASFRLVTCRRKPDAA
jgi:23S rRNA (guanine745-N1)-methyltransferase